ncbi:MAG: ABC transporter ATP-binding protein, partial [Beijerinckiaceae bacterium]
RCLLQNPKLLIFDEPTSVLTPGEADTLMVTLRGLRDEGRAILYISHKLDEVRALCDRATILRGGKVVGVADPRVESSRSLAAAMVGADIRTLTLKAARAAGDARIALQGLSLASDNIHGVDLHDVTLTVRAGEILGLAGIAGNGQSELFAALSGEMRAPRRDMIALDGQAAGHLGIEARRRFGAAFVPEERNGHAACADYSLTDTVLLSHHGDDNYVRNGLVRHGPARALAQRIIAAFDVRTSGPEQLAGKLSGGNLQKFLVGREVIGAPKILIINQPTWGVDAAAAASIRQTLIDLATQGTAVLVISQDLDDLFEIADTIAVIHQGRVSQALPAATTTRDDIGLLMAGQGFGEVRAAAEAAHAH